MSALFRAVLALTVVSVLTIASGAVPRQAAAFETLTFLTPGAPDDLRADLRGVSLLRAAKSDGQTEGQDILAAAQAEYGRLLGALYAAGYYSAAISVKVDGTEAADVPALDAPESVRSVTVEVRAGPRFAFARAVLSPLAPGTALPVQFRTGGIARGTVVQEAVSAGTDRWRAIGHAKVKVASQSLTADHRAATLDARIAFAPGPRVTFGALRITGNQAVRTGRVADIAGFPTGKVYDPALLDRVGLRLRRTGAFRSVTLTEAEALGPGDTLDLTAALIEAPPRRLGFGAEVASAEGLSLSAYWMHRNLLGGAENLRIEAAVDGIGGQTGGLGYSLSARLQRPATFSPDTTGYVDAGIGQEDETDYKARTLSFGIGFRQDFSEDVRAEAGISYEFSDVTDAVATTTYRQLAFPISGEFDRRNDDLDPTRGYYMTATITPFLGFGTTQSGVRTTFEARGYRGFGTEDRVVLAGRAQIGAIFGSGLIGTPRGYLFYSGGGGTVRGQPYQSLGVVDPVTGVRTGGVSFLAVSGEARVDVNRRLQAVAFYDTGYVGGGDFFDDDGGWHAGAGVGLRYQTGIGPIRLDVATPVGGDTGEGVQFYVGIGQAF